MSENVGKVPRPWWRRVIYGLVISLAVSATLLGISLIGFRDFFAVEIVNNFRLQVSVGIFVSSVLSLLWQARVWAAIQFVLGIAVVFPILQAMLPSNPLTPPGKKVVKLISYNVLADNDDHENVVETIKQQDPDIVVVIEYANRWIDALQDLERDYPYAVKEPRWHGFGIALYSKLRIIDSKIHAITRDVTDNPLLVAEVQVEDRAVVVVAGHFLAPLTIDKMKIRNRQFAEASQIISDTRQVNKTPVIFVGDLNCVPWSPRATELMKNNNLHDSRQGYGYHGSWPTGNLLMRIPIDNAFVSENIHIHNRKILSADSSDHFPLYLDFSIGD